MATNQEFIEFVCDQVSDCGVIRSKKMFGEYMVYVNDKPILLVCDNTVYVKKLEILEQLMSNAELGIPYPGSKEHYILEIDNADLSKKVIDLLEPITPIPKKRKQKTKK
jgi:TfoX/Sxy family transcriptional regulator of competence genes